MIQRKIKFSSLKVGEYFISVHTGEKMQKGEYDRQLKGNLVLLNGKVIGYHTKDAKVIRYKE